jgi:hypothetical protein
MIVSDGEARGVAAGLMAFASTSLVGFLSWAWSMLLEAGSPVGSTGLVARSGPSIAVVVVVAGAVGMVALASTFVVGVDLGMAGRRQMELQSSLLEPGSPVGDLHNSRQILPEVDRQGADYRTPRADMEGLVDDTVPAEYLGAAVGYSDTLGRRDCCLPTSAAVA